MTNTHKPMKYVTHNYRYAAKCLCGWEHVGPLDGEAADRDRAIELHLHPEAVRRAET